MKLSYERYLALARAEAQNGNAVAAENYYQHAEHYFRSMHSGSIREVSVPRLPSLKPQSPRLGLFTLSYQFGLRTICCLITCIPFLSVNR